MYFKFNKCSIQLKNHLSQVYQNFQNSTDQNFQRKRRKIKTKKNQYIKSISQHVYLNKIHLKNKTLS